MLISEVLDETLAAQEGDLDADSRFALAWLEQHGFVEGEYSVQKRCRRPRETSVAGLAEAGVLQ